MVEGDRLLLGTDIVKDHDRLVAAYDDVAGVTAEFKSLNVLAVLNRELGADFDVDRFEHVARYDEVEDRIEMRLRSQGAQVVRVDELDLLDPDLRRRRGHPHRDRRKFRPTVVRAELIAAGLTPSGWWTDPAGDFGLTLAVK